MVRFLKRRGKPERSEPDEKVVETIDTGDDFKQENTMKVERKVYSYPKFNRQYPASVYTGFSLIALLNELYVKHFKPSKQCAMKQFKNRLPVIQMIKTYKIKEYLFGDIISGITVNYSI